MRSNYKATYWNHGANDYEYRNFDDLTFYEALSASHEFMNDMRHKFHTRLTIIALEIRK